METIKLFDNSIACIGDKVETRIKTFNEADIHYFRENPRTIPANTIVEIKNIFTNFYGKYITVEYEGNKLDIRPSDVILKRK